MRLHGGRYLPEGSSLPKLRSWIEEHFDVDLGGHRTPSQKTVLVPHRHSVPAFESALRTSCPSLEINISSQERLAHSHGHTVKEIFQLRFGNLQSIVDMVVYPSCAEEIQSVVRLVASSRFRGSVGLIPFGGGTNVSQALLCPVLPIIGAGNGVHGPQIKSEKKSEKRGSKQLRRLLLSVDMKKMNQIKWVDPESLLACVGAGVVGVDLERRLKSTYGLCTGHEPDSSEFSTLGGWIATRASGMRKNRYGNIEDIVQAMSVVLADGTKLTVPHLGPRQSVGPDLRHLLLGSEGTLGIITDATVRLSILPSVKAYGSLIFPSFAHGVRFMRALSKSRVFPASVRLMDNLQFQVSHELIGGSVYYIKIFPLESFSRFCFICCSLVKCSSPISPTFGMRLKAKFLSGLFWST